MKGIVAVGFILLLGVLSLIAYQQYEHNQLIQRDRNGGQVAKARLEEQRAPEKRRDRLPAPTQVSAEPKLTIDEVITAIEQLRGFDAQRSPRMTRDNNGAVVALELPPGTKITSTVLGYLKSLSELEFLSLKASSIRDAGLEHLKGLSKLKALDLSICYVSDSGMAHLKGLPKLEILDLNGTRVSGAGLVHLKKITTLLALNIGQNKNVTDVDVAHLKSLTNLRGLNLSAAKITDAGLTHLRVLKRLEKLDLSLISTITPAGVRELRRALPGCQIEEPVP